MFADHPLTDHSQRACANLHCLLERCHAHIPNPDGMTWHHCPFPPDKHHDQIAIGLLGALEPMLAEFGARLSDGKPLGYTVGSMDRALEMVEAAEVAITKARGECRS